MKIIDEKGMLFSRINIIDFVVIIFLVTLFIPSAYFLYKVYSRKPTVIKGPPKIFQEIEENFRIIKIDPATAGILKTGDVGIDETGERNGEIVWIGETSPHLLKFNIGMGKVISKMDPSLKDIQVKLKLKVELRGDSLYYNNLPITLESPAQFRSKEYVFSFIPEIVEPNKNIKRK